MEQAKTPAPPPQNPSPPSPPAAALTSKEKKNNKSKPPTPEELVAHYESQGLEPKEASLKVIQDLQSILYKTVVSGRGRKEKFMSETTRKLDNVNTRLAIVEMKLDSRPGFPGTFVLGMASGAAVKGVGAVFPPVLRAFGQLWDAVRSLTKGHPSP